LNHIYYILKDEKMKLYNDNWKVEIKEIPNYNPDSLNNIKEPDAHFVFCNDSSKTLLLKISDIVGTNEKKIVLTVSLYTPQNDFAFLEDSELYLFLNDTVCVYNLQSGDITKQKKIDISGSLFSVYKYQKDFILYCEVDIIRMNRNLDVIWDFMARDIFVRQQGTEPAFVMKVDRIQLYDFLNNYYEIDYDGRIIKD